MFFVKYPDPCIRHLKSVTDLPGTIIGTIIDQKDLQIRIRLVCNTLHAVF